MMPILAERMKKAGFSEEEVEKIVIRICCDSYRRCYEIYKNAWFRQ